MLALLSSFKIKPIILKPILLIKQLIYIFFLVAYPILIYSTLIIEVDTIFCFLLYYNATALIKKKQFSITNFLISGFLVKLLLPYLIRPYSKGSEVESLSDC